MPLTNTTISQSPLEFCPICNAPRMPNGDGCGHWVDDMIDGCVEWRNGSLPCDLNAAVSEFTRAWFKNTPRSRATANQVRKLPISRYLKRLWAKGSQDELSDDHSTRRGDQARTMFILRAGGLRLGLSPRWGQDRSGLYMGPEEATRVAAAIEEVRKATEAIEEIHDEVLFDIYFDESIQHGVDHEDICRDLDFDQWKHDRWLASLGDQGLKQLADRVVGLLGNMKGDRRPKPRGDLEPDELPDDNETSQDTGSDEEPEVTTKPRWLN